MRIGPEEVLHVARLAELAVAEEDLETLASQLDGIVEYVAQLDALPAEGGTAAFIPGPDEVTLRADEVAPQPLALPPAALAPEFREGFFVVPRLAAMEQE
ncbi:MAG TPA: Asp-tRNA(Asn)/Glu-tRNA(Gln) amidotransferase subunit GatC [Gemmatimonadales bacterium]|nr:Asp-tRNA(Asn)/Glu-tRNA(Gln) amidotransferase subunit GatC [Gemmatimonadales bacterium]